MTEAELRRIFAGREAAAGRRGDHDLEPDIRPEGVLRPAAVLVPIVLHADEPTILLTLRTPHLHAHAGQIAFPGGGVDPGDVDRRATALRETQEEVGLDPAAVEIIGELDAYVTRTGFDVAPFVGLLRPPLVLAPDPFEVADIFEIPLSFVLGPGQPERHSRAFQGRERAFWAFPWRDRYVWGATAGMLRNLRHALIGEDAA
jgi:8-oxo-dGTP pyrophosphatase MutT (NUDIX family)